MKIFSGSPFLLTCCAAVLTTLVASSKDLAHSLQIENASPNAIYLDSTQPKITLPPGYKLASATINDQPYQGKPIAHKGLNTLTLNIEPAPNQGGEPSTHTTQFIILHQQGRAPVHTIELERQHLAAIKPSKFVKPTQSADENFVIGRSKGWPSDPKVPSHELHAYQITNFNFEPEGAQKIKIILSDGNHPVEQTGSWGFRAAIDFLLGDSTEAKFLRDHAHFFCYPMLNPDGRYLVKGRGNPELSADGIKDHNRVWHTNGKYSTIDAYKTAMVNDTGGSVDYYLDFHSGGSNFFFSSPHLMQAPLARAVTNREPEILPRKSGGKPGMTRIWAMSEQGLKVPIAYTPEFKMSETAPRSLEIGQNWMRSLYDLFTAQLVLDYLENLKQPATKKQFTPSQLKQLKQLGQQISNQRATMTTPQRIKAVDEFFELYNQFSN